MNNKRKATTDGNDSASNQATKRVRVSRACDQCRAAREKCNGSTPCQTCKTQRRPCSYDEQPKKRGIQPNYIRTLELSLALLFRTFPAKHRYLAKILSSAHDHDHQLIAFRDTTASDTLHAVWRDSIVAKQVDQLLSGAEVDPYDNDVPVDEVADPPEDQGSPKMSRSNASTSNDLARTLATAPGKDDLCLPVDSWELCEHFFAFTQTWLPILEKHDILKLLYNYPTEGLPKTHVMASDHAELWSIIALASLQKGSHDATKYQQIAKSLIPDAKDGSFRIGHVKALLILTLVEVANGSWLPAWILTGSAIRILAYIDSSSNVNGGTALPQSKHVCLAAFLLERVVAFRTGARMYLHTSQVHSAGLLVEDGLEEWAPWHDPGAAAMGVALKRSPARSVSTFNRLLRIAAAPRQQGFGIIGDGTDAATSAVLKLLKNASISKGRIQPFVLLEEMWPIMDKPDESHIGNGLSSHISRPEPTQSQFWEFVGSEFGSTPMKRPYSFVTIPNESSEPIIGATSAQMHADAVSPSLWTSDTTNPIQNSSNIESAADIFEEFAMLDRVDPSSHPHFMQNLGFGPELDLAEFFGSDYQPTNPAIEHLPNTGTGLEQDDGGCSKGIG